MPRTLGESFIHVSQIDFAVEVDYPPYPYARPAIGPVERQIGAFVADLIPDGATLQLGIGAIPAATAELLTSKRDLGVHTEMFTDAIVDLVEAGVVTGDRKARNRGKLVATFLMGTQRLYEFIHDNPMVEMRPVEFTNDTHVIRSLHNMVAINSAIEVDLTGQVCSDSIGPRIYSGFGGQVDFIRGAAQSKGGKPIIALSACAQGGETSRIVPYLKQGAGVVTTRADVHYVVTEFGAAHIFGRNLRERCEALINISHPKFRDELTAKAKERKLIV
jgi:acyl-CoA hydrolase